MRNSLFWFIIRLFISIISISICKATGSGSKTTKYEPLYLIELPGEYKLLGTMTHHPPTKDYSFQVPPTSSVSVACPKSKDSTKALHVIKQITQQVAIGLECDEPLSPVVTKSLDPGHYSIGFNIYKERIDPNYVAKAPNVPQGQYNVHLLVSVLDLANLKVWFVYHHIILGEFLDDQLPYHQQIPPYEKNLDLYVRDIDDLYEESNQVQRLTAKYGEKPSSSLVKLQLAPEHDFFMANYKAASRANINTAPIWEILTTQWNLLEKFIRKVALHLSHLVILTGTSNGDTKHASDALMYLHPENKLPVSKYLWKIAKYRYQVGKEHRLVGILFVMHNDPYSQHQEPLCNDVSNPWSWTFLGDYSTKSLFYACAVNAENTKKLGVTDNEGKSMGDFNLKDIPSVVNRKSDGGAATAVESVYDKINSSDYR